MFTNPWKTVAMLTLLAPLPLLAADWPAFRGPDASGFSPETGINKNWTQQPPQVLWQAPMGDNGFAGPSVADGKVFIIDHRGSDDVVRAIDLRTGSNVWTYTYADNSKENYGFARATPTVDQGKVYCVSRLGIVNCLDEKTGKLLWSKNLVTELHGQTPQWLMAWSPVVDGNQLIVLPGGKDASVAALDKRTGQTLWTGGGSDKPGYATPVVATINGRKQYVVFTAKRLIGVDAANGKELWELPWRTDYDVNAAMPIVVGNQVLIASGYKHGCALVTITADQAAIAWESKDLAPHFNSPIYRDGYLYGISDSGNLVCLEWKTGKLLWQKAGFQKGGVAGVDGAIIAVTGDTGLVVLAELSPQAYHELGRIQPLGGQSWSPPVVAEGKLIVRNTKALACVALKPAAGR